MIFRLRAAERLSARDIQQWEYVPLGPFQPRPCDLDQPVDRHPRALEPFRVHGPAGSAPLPLSAAEQPNNYDLQLDVGLARRQMNEPSTFCRTNFKYMYWSSVQQLVHSRSSGCAMNVGDLPGLRHPSAAPRKVTRQPAGNFLERQRAG